MIYQNVRRLEHGTISALSTITSVWKLWVEQEFIKLKGTLLLP